MNNELWMITGLHDPRWFSNIIKNYKRQKYNNKKLIIVENGNGIGITKNHKLPQNTFVIQSEKGPAQPLNAALKLIRSKGNENSWFCKCDSDDYYGPKYLDSIKEAINSGADYCGRNSLYIKTTDNRLWYINGDSRNNYLFHGPTLSARVSASLDFKIVKDWGEDNYWCNEMHKEGKNPFTINPEGFCYQRWSDYQHTWPCTDFEIRTSWQTEFIDIGKFDVNIINGIKQRPIGKSLGVAEFTFENSMAVRVLMEQLKSNPPFINQTF